MDSYILKSDADAVILGGDFNTGPEKTEGSPFQILTSRGLTNSVQEIFYKLDAWLHTEFSTYGNPRNTFSYTYSPIIYTTNTSRGEIVIHSRNFRCNKCPP